MRLSTKDKDSTGCRPYPSYNIFPMEETRITLICKLLGKYINNLINNQIFYIVF